MTRPGDPWTHPGTGQPLAVPRRDPGTDKQAAAERDVLEKAKLWRAARPGPWVSGTDVEFHLFVAVGTLIEAELR